MEREERVQSEKTRLLFPVFSHVIRKIESSNEQTICMEFNSNLSNKDSNRVISTSPQKPEQTLGTSSVALIGERQNDEPR
mmetsp:Transcript_18790/g.75412  ORF Transcript_18790/g.75412 Transcript_18790/m.75412 type:complete len:80 (-) Transcript_18790:491-730(-)